MSPVESSTSLTSSSQQQQLQQQQLQPQPQLHTETQQNGGGQKRIRIQKACDTCRSKKIKCNGDNPCKNCQSSGSTCTYNHVPKKRVMKKRKTALLGSNSEGGQVVPLSKSSSTQSTTHASNLPVMSPPMKLTNSMGPSFQGINGHAPSPQAQTNTAPHIGTSTASTPTSTTAGTVAVSEHLERRVKNMEFVISQILEHVATLVGQSQSPSLTPLQSQSQSQSQTPSQSQLPRQQQQTQLPPQQQRAQSQAQSQTQLRQQQTHNTPDLANIMSPNTSDNASTNINTNTNTGTLTGDTNPGSAPPTVDNTVPATVPNSINGQATENNLLKDDKSSTANSNTVAAPNITAASTATATATTKTTGPSGDHEGFILVTKSGQEFYFETQSLFSVFSPRGVKSIANKIGDINLLKFMQRVYISCHSEEENEVEYWTRPIDTKEVTELPSLPIFLFCLDLLYATPLAMFFDLKREELTTLYKNHLSNARKLNYSEALLLNIVICIGVHSLEEKYSKSHLFRNSFANLKISMDDFKALEDQCLNNCLYYYHRVSIISHGVTTVAAYGLLYSYSEIAALLPVQFRLVSTMARSAQEMGLHRAEVYHGFKKDDAMRKLSLFINTFMIDKMNSLKSGRPPVFNDDDISSIDVVIMKHCWLNNENDMSGSFSIKRYLKGLELPEATKAAMRKEFSTKEAKDKIVKFISANPEAQVPYFMRLFLLDLLMITSNLYKSLFGARALIGKSAAQIDETVTKMSAEVQDWYESVPDIFKMDLDNPQNEFFTKFYESDLAQNASPAYHDTIVSTIIYIHLQYNHMLMTITRMSSASLWGATNDRRLENAWSPSVKLCLQSARNTIKIASTIAFLDSHFFRVVYLYPLCAFITLFCSTLQDVEQPFVRDDLDLMITAVDVLDKAAIAKVSSKIGSAVIMIKMLCFMGLRHYLNRFPEEVSHFANESRASHTLKHIDMDYQRFCREEKRKNSKNRTEHDVESPVDSLKLVPSIFGPSASTLSDESDGVSFISPFHDHHHQSQQHHHHHQQHHQQQQQPQAQQMQQMQQVQQAQAPLSHTYHQAQAQYLHEQHMQAQQQQQQQQAQAAAQIFPANISNLNPPYPDQRHNSSSSSTTSTTPNNMSNIFTSPQFFDPFDTLNGSYYLQNVFSLPTFMIDEEDMNIGATKTSY